MSTLMSTMIIKGGYVFDPLNEINGDVKDIFIKSGKVVADLSAAEAREAVVIDASGKTVMPGGVDSHAHLAGPKVNAGRLMRPEDHYKSVRAKTALTHSAAATPSLLSTSRDMITLPWATRLSSRPPCRHWKPATLTKRCARPRYWTWAPTWSWATTGSSCVTSTTATSRRPPPTPPG